MSAPAARSSTSRSDPLNALTRRLTMTGSPSSGVSAACTWVAGWSCVYASPPCAVMAENVALDSADLGVAGPEAHADEHHRDASRPGGLGRAVRGVDDGRRAEALHDAVLEVHQEQDGAGTGHGHASRSSGLIFRPNLSDQPDESAWIRRGPGRQASSTPGTTGGRLDHGKLIHGSVRFHT